MTIKSQITAVTRYSRLFDNQTCPIMNEAVSKARTEYAANIQNGGNNTQYKFYIANGWDATNGYNRVVQSYSTSNLHASGTVKTSFINQCTQKPEWTFTVDGSLFYGLITDSALAVDTRHATGALLDHLRDFRSKFQSGTFLGELRETLSLIRNPAKTLRNSIDHYLKTASKIRRGSNLEGRSRIRAANKAIQNVYLEAQFGWKPLVSDIRSAVEAYDALTSSPSNKVVRSHARASKADPPSSAMPAWSYGAVYQATTVIRYESEVRYTMGMGETSSNRLRANDILGLDPFQDFLPTVWELIPYSFVIDYFVNIGDIINQTFTSTEFVRYLVQTRVDTGSYRYDWQPRGFADPLTSGSSTGGTSTGSFKRITRVALSPGTDLKADRLTVKLPGMMQGFNLSSLLASRIKSK